MPSTSSLPGFPASFDGKKEPLRNGKERNDEVLLILRKSAKHAQPVTPLSE